MGSSDLERAIQLKQELLDFVYDAEGDLAIALEAYVAQQGSRDRQSYDPKQQSLVVDEFLSEGKVGSHSPIELFIAEEGEFSDRDIALLQSWHNSFTGLFEVVQVSSDRFELTNWLTAKAYTVFPNQEVPIEETTRWQRGDILLTRLAPISDGAWMFSGSCIFKGKLGKPKLAVALGEFKKNYPSQLYSDAPDLLEQAWESVAQYHHEFVEFFGGDRVTLPGYQLERKLVQLQEKMSQTRLEAAGIDSSKSLKEIARERGIEELELSAVAEESGADSKEMTKLLDNKLNSRMVAPKVNLPEEVKKAEKVAVFSHPRWGQMIVQSYPKLQTLLETEDPLEQENCEVLIRQSLENPQINYFVWQQLKEEYPASLERVLQGVLNRPNFNLESDLETTLTEFNKPLEPDLPEIASVPLHLHELFEEAVEKVNKSKSKSKKKKKTSKGFHSQ
ncbi:MAG: hypothetical protein SW833_15260 [Cyanobacteriota bacterium]|nr:hypothetical protein [Cyanobacteriota bacterium]